MVHEYIKMDDSTQIDVEELSELVSVELDKLINDRFHKYDESLKDFGEHINNFHKVLMKTRKDAEKMLENEKRRREEELAKTMENDQYQQEQQQDQNNIVNNDNINDINNDHHKFRDMRDSTAIDNRGRHKLGTSKSAPNLATPSKNRINHIRRRNSPRNLKPL